MNFLDYKRQVELLLFPDSSVGKAVALSRKHHYKHHSSRKDSVRSRIYLDLSVLSKHDAGTGIQRVVRSIANGLLGEKSAPWTVLPVTAFKNSPYQTFVWPNTNVSNLLTDTQSQNRLDYQTAQSGDIFFGLDFALDDTYRHKEQLKRLQLKGVRFWFLLHDLLPIQHPEWFSRETVIRFNAWLRVIVSLAEGIFCVSDVVAIQLREYFHGSYKLATAHIPAIHTIPIGGDIRHSPHSLGVSTKVAKLLPVLERSKTILIVGTLEPRKGHQDLLNALDLLWEKESDINLLIVGRMGWKTQDLQEGIQNHALLNRRLWWIDSATDEEVEQFYKACSGVVIASYGEGLCLPLIEALSFRKSVLARDLPVLHTIINPNVTFFPANATASDLAKAVKTWIMHCVENNVYEDSVPLPTWLDTITSIKEALLNDSKDFS